MPGRGRSKSRGASPASQSAKSKDRGKSKERGDRQHEQDPRNVHDVEVLRRMVHTLQNQNQQLKTQKPELSASEKAAKEAASQNKQAYHIMIEKKVSAQVREVIKESYKRGHNTAINKGLNWTGFWTMYNDAEEKYVNDMQVILNDPAETVHQNLESIHENLVHKVVRKGDFEHVRRTFVQTVKDWCKQNKFPVYSGKLSRGDISKIRKEIMAKQAYDEKEVYEHHHVAGASSSVHYPKHMEDPHEPHGAKEHDLMPDGQGPPPGSHFYNSLWPDSSAASSRRY